MTILALFGFVLVGAVVAAAAFVHSRQQAYARAEEWRQLQAAERRRVEACGQVVLSFANHLGYIARTCISREEIGNLIDGGISPDRLAQTIGSRIDAADGLVLGYHPGASGVDVKLTDEHRERHIYIVGKSGSGKTNLLRNLILQDIHAGRGVGVIAPEAEMLTEELLPFVPNYRIQDVIYCDPSDPECPVSFNPLHLDEGEDLDTKVDEALTIFKRVIGNSTGHRSEEILRQALYALVAMPDTTLLDIERLLDRTDAAFRTGVIRSSHDEGVRHFWRDVYSQMPKDSHMPIISRLGRFIRPQAVRQVLCRKGASLNFREAMDEGRIMLFNLSDGILGEQNSQLLGQLVVSKFQLATMSRATQAKEHRRPFYLYLDEFQTFTGTAATSYERMLSRARKYKLSLTLAHQQTGQLPSDLLKEIMGNVSTSVCFLVSREDAMKFSREFVTLHDGEIVNIPEEEILRLRVGQAWCKIGQHSFLMHTYLADGQPDKGYAAHVIGESYRNYQALLPPADEGGDVAAERNVEMPYKEAAPVREPALSSSAAQTAGTSPPSGASVATAAAGANSTRPIDALSDLDPANLFGE